MLLTAQLQQLKRTNISVDSEKTRQRVDELWTSLKIKQKQAIRALAGITAQPIYRTQEAGNISAKVAIAIAQTLNINPFYLTGEADEPGECTDAVLRKLLLKHGYQALAASIEIPEDIPERHVNPKSVQKEEIPTVPELLLPPGSDTLTVEDLQHLIFALYVQAKAGITNSKEKLDQIKTIMLT